MARWWSDWPYTEPKINANCEAKCRFNVFDTLADKATMNRLVRGHFTNGRELQIHDHTVSQLVYCFGNSPSSSHAVMVYAMAVPAGPAMKT